MRVLMDGAELLAALVLGEAGVGTEGGDLLLAVSEDGLKFCSLVGGQVQFFTDPCGFLLRVMGVVVEVLSLWGGRRRRG